MMRITLTKHETGWLRDGPVFASGVVIRYRVGSMPPGEEADLHNFGAPSWNDWQIYRVSKVGHKTWTGHFSSADKALVQVQREVDASLRSRHT